MPDHDTGYVRFCFAKGYLPRPAGRGLSYARYMLTNGPLAGLRVVELTDDTGRFSGKILAESGASVVRIGAASSGPSMLATVPRGGLLDWWYDGGKQMVWIDLSTGSGQSEYRRLAEMADLVVESEPPGRLADLGLDHADLVSANPALVQVSLTPSAVPAPGPAG